MAKASKKKAKSGGKKKRTPAQIAATKKMIAANKRKKAGKKSAAKARPKKARKAKKASAASSSATATKVTRSKKRSASSAGRKGGKTMKKGKRKSRARSLLKGAGSAVKGGLIGGGSALASDVVLGLGVVPAPLKTGVGNVLARTALAFGAGVAVQKLTKSHESGRDATVGAMSVMFRDVGRNAIKSRFPSVPMGELADLSDALGFDDVTEEEMAGLAALIDGEMDGANALEMGEAFDDVDVDGLGEDFEFMDGLGGELAVMR